MELVVNTPFLTYNVGDLITDPAVIASVLAGQYANDVVVIGQSGGQSSPESITLAVTSAVTGSALGLSGSISNATPSQLDYSIDGATWSPVTSFNLTNGNYTGRGPTYSTAQSGSIQVRDHASQSVVSSSVNFTVTVSSSGGATGGTLTLADGSKIDALGAGLEVAGGSGSPGALAVNFGTITGTVADGGMLAVAAAQAATALADAEAGGAPVGTQAWVDQTGTAAIFHRGPVPPALSIRPDLTFGDKLKVLGVFNFSEVWDTQASYDAYPNLQNFLLYCQLMALAMKNTSLENVFYRICVDCYLARGVYYTSSPLVIPEYVRLTGPGVILRTPYVGVQSGGTLTPGPFYATGPTSMGMYLPTVIIPPRAHAERLHIYVNGNPSSVYFRGSGVAIGRFWCWQYESAVTIGSAGSGYSVGDFIYSASPEISPYQAGYIVVDAVNGSGGVTAAHVYEGDRLDNGGQGCGAFGLPPALQIQQWTTANGFAGVFDPANAGYFLAAVTYNSAGAAGTGTGCSWLPTWCGDFGNGNYNYGGWGMLGGKSASQRSALQADTIVEHINITGGVHGANSSTYGNTFNVQVTGLNGIIGEIEVLTGAAGLNFIFANDWRVGHANCVESGTGIFMFSCGSIEIVNAVLDTCGCALYLNECGRISIKGMVFFEQANLIGPVYPDSQGNAVIIGNVSNASFPNQHLDIDLTLINMGGIPSSTLTAFPNLVTAGNVAVSMPASISLAYIKASRLKFNISNWDESGTVYTYLPTMGFVTFGPGVDGSVTIEGLIDQITGPACIGNVSTTPCAVRVWDAPGGATLAGWPGGWAGQYGTYEIKAPGAPATGLGAGKAGPGSTYTDAATGLRYRQTGTLSSPTWTTP